MQMQDVEITQVIHDTDRLFRIRTERPQTLRFQAGEFVMLGLPGVPVKRAYSITSGPYDDYLEFYSIKAPGGEFTSKLIQVEPGDVLQVGNKPTGTLTASSLTQGGSLWMFATGTGVAPFISLLRDPYTHEAFTSIHLAWSVRSVEDLAAYHDFLESLDIDYLPTVTQEPYVNQGRIQSHIDSGRLLPNCDPKDNKVMLCGSIEFNSDLKALLEQQGFLETSSTNPGVLVLERAFVG